MKTKKIISPYFEDGEFTGVRVTLGDEDFVIATKNYQDGKEMSWRAAMDTLKAEGLTTWNYRQICLTMAYRKEIDDVLTNNGGDNLDDWYWTCTEYLDDYSFYCYGKDGRLTIDLKYVANSVRPIKNLKK